MYVCVCVCVCVCVYVCVCVFYIFVSLTVICAHVLEIWVEMIVSPAFLFVIMQFYLQGCLLKPINHPNLLLWTVSFTEAREISHYTIALPMTARCAYAQ